MKRLDLGGLRVLLAGGTDGEGGGEGALVVLMHGFGAPGDDLASLWRVVAAPPGTRWAFPAAPLALQGMGPEGRAWWKIDIMRHLMEVERGGGAAQERDAPAGMSEANAHVVALLDELDARLRPSKVVLGGFSQGAMLACDVALRTDRPLAGIALLSGTLVAGDDWTPLAAHRRGLPVFQSHGTEDAMLSYAQAEKLRDLLRQGGAEVTWVPFKGGHQIPAPVIDALGRWMRAALA
jgi:phospholipase/carboxylesterase